MTSQGFPLPVSQDADDGADPVEGGEHRPQDVRRHVPPQQQDDTHEDWPDRDIHEEIPAEAVQQSAPAQPAPEVRAVSPETRENNQLLKDLEQHSSIAAMLANVPVLNFPEDDPKYDSSRKYNYA